MNNWCAVIDNTFHFSWSIYKPNSLLIKNSLEGMITQYGVLFPVTLEGFNFLDWAENGEKMPSGSNDAVVAGILINSLGKAYYTVQEPDGSFGFRRLAVAKGFSFIVSNHWATEESLQTILSYTRDPVEFIKASDKVLTTNVGLRHFMAIEDMAAMIKEKKESLPISVSLKEKL